MAKKRGKRENDDCALDMTPMIDVVFQLIIFFVVTLKTTAAINEKIVLEYAKNSPEIEEQTVPPLVVEVDRWGYISVMGAKINEGMLRKTVKGRIARMGTNFPLMIRVDKNAKHEDVRKVMDICSALGVYKIAFVAMVKEAQ